MEEEEDPHPSQKTLVLLALCSSTKIMIRVVLLFLLVGTIHGKTTGPPGIVAIERSLVAPSPPSWPSSFEMQYTIELPYIQTVQIVGLK